MKAGRSEKNVTHAKLRRDFITSVVKDGARDITTCELHYDVQMAGFPCTYDTVANDMRVLNISRVSYWAVGVNKNKHSA